MVSKLIKYLVGTFCAFGLLTSAAFASCSGQFQAGQVCGVSGSSQAVPTGSALSPILDRNFGAPSAQGTILNRGSSLWSATGTPVLGVAGSSQGSLGLAGASGGVVTLQGQTSAGTWTFTLPTSGGTSGYILSTDGTGVTSWVNNSAGGTVQSVALALPNIFTVSGSPITTTGTLTGTLATQTKNLVWAGPGSGSAAAPTFRALVGADLPVPSASTLGGVESLTCSSSNWLNNISTGGVPSCTQPAFTDISGSVAAAQLPNPSASTLGGIESLVAVSHKWINTISTSGVPAATQPAFTDIFGNTTLSQLPSIGNNAVIGNNSGGTSTPSALTATQVLDMIGVTQGAVLYRDSAVWKILAPGTNGQVLTTAGAAANPTWTTVTGTGTVTDIAAGTGIYTGGSDITTTGTISLASIANNRVLANVSGISAAPSATTATLVLDIIGSTEGDVLYRGASAWLALAPGTNGQVLQTQGAGATPQWANAGTVSSFTIAAGTGISVAGTCTITTSGTCTASITNTAVTPASYTNANITVNQQGQITAASNGTAAGLSSHVGSFTRNPSTTNGNVAYTGIGFQPTSCNFTGGSNFYIAQSIGFTDSTKAGRLFYSGTGLSYAYATLANDNTDDGPTLYDYATIASYDADGFTLTWTKVGSPTSSTITINFICYK